MPGVLFLLAAVGFGIVTQRAVYGGVRAPLNVVTFTGSQWRVVAGLVAVPVGTVALLLLFGPRVEARVGAGASLAIFVASTGALLGVAMGVAPRAGAGTD